MGTLIFISLMGVKRRIKIVQFVFTDEFKYFYGSYVQYGMRDKLRRIGLPQPGLDLGYNPGDLVEVLI